MRASNPARRRTQECVASEARVASPVAVGRAPPSTKQGSRPGRQGNDTVSD